MSSNLHSHQVNAAKFIRELLECWIISEIQGEASSSLPKFYMCSPVSKTTNAYISNITAALILEWTQISERFLWLDTAASGAISPARKTCSFSCGPNLKLSCLGRPVWFYWQTPPYCRSQVCAPGKKGFPENTVWHVQEHCISFRVGHLPVQYYLGT